MRSLPDKTTWIAFVVMMLGGAPLPGKESVIKAIEDAGGVVHSHGAGWQIEFHRRGEEVGDAVLAHVAELGGAVRSLNLRGTRTTDEGLKHLSNLENLTRLHLERTVVGDEGMAHLAGLTKLQYLNLYGTKVTDAGLARLGSMRELKKLLSGRPA